MSDEIIINNYLGGKNMNKRSIFVLLALNVGFIFVFGEALALYAQENNDSEFTLEEITVTAQKRAENQQKVAIPMEVISGENLAATGKTNVEDILGNISNVQINNSSDGMRVAIRGLVDDSSAFHDMHTSSPQVAINIDGAYNNLSSGGQNLFDVERVEVLMGPQSTLYASTSPGGIVNIITTAPKTDKYSASAQIDAGNFDYRQFQAMVNAPIVTDKMAMRLSVQQEKRSTYYANSNDEGENTKSVRLKTLYKPTESFSINVTGTYSNKINGGMMGGQVTPFDKQNGTWYQQQGMDGPWVAIGKVTNPWTEGTAPAGGPPGAPGNGPNSGKLTTKGISGEISWDISKIGSLSVVPNYTVSSTNDVGQYWDNGVHYNVYNKMKATNKAIEARMTSDPDFPFKWILGGTYFKTNQVRHTTYNEPMTVDPVSGRANAEPGVNTTFENNKAIFANVTYPFFNQFRGTVGFRQTWDKSENVEVPPMVGNGVSGQPYSNPDYKIGVEYDLNKNSMLYADFSTSYRINAMIVAQGSRTGEPEKLQAFTAGAKNRFLDNTLQLNASAFYYNYKNKGAQVTGEGRLGGMPGGPPATPVYADELIGADGQPVYGGAHIDIANDPSKNTDPWIQQFGNFRSIGLDVSADWLLTANDKFNLGVSYLSAKWSDLRVQFYWKKKDGSKFWSLDGSDFSGRTNTNSPKLSLNGGYEHTFELGSIGTLVPHADIQYKSSYVLDYAPINDTVDHQESYCIVNGNITYTDPSGKYSFNAYVKNATNYAAKNFWMNMSGTATIGITDPRTYGAVLSVKF
jgi:iron complex outermembrane recepter protein